MHANLELVCLPFITTGPSSSLPRILKGSWSDMNNATLALSGLVSRGPFLHPSSASATGSILLLLHLCGLLTYVQSH